MTGIVIKVSVAGFTLQFNLGPRLDLSLLLDLLIPESSNLAVENLNSKPLPSPRQRREEPPVSQDQHIQETSAIHNPHGPIIFSDSTSCAALLSDSNGGFKKGYQPELCEEGAGGTYFLRNERGSPVAVFKPADEEPNSPNNPKLQGAVVNHSESLRHGIESGEGAIREVAAYVVDSQSEPSLTAGVPPTYLATLLTENKSQHGSLQEFVEDSIQSWDNGPSGYHVDEVHRIGILDIRLLNTDRHGGNILVRDNQLVPIDHAFCLPESLDGGIWFEWMTWPQAKKPFSPEVVDAIGRLNIAQHLQQLKTLGVSEIALALSCMSSILLQTAVRLGMTLYDIGSIICRSSPSEPSQFELLVRKTIEMSDCDSILQNYRSLLKQLLAPSVIAEVN